VLVCGCTACHDLSFSLASRINIRIRRRMDELRRAEDHCQVQLSGVLAKRPVGHDATRWSKRLVNLFVSKSNNGLWTRYVGRCIEFINCNSFFRAIFA